MNPIAEEILSYYGVSEDPALLHYGKKRRSGRYPWGSGENPYQHGADFYSRTEELKKMGLSETEMCEWFKLNDNLDISTGQLRAYKAAAKAERDALRRDTIRSMREDGKTFTEIGKELGMPASSVQNLLKNEEQAANSSKAMATAEILKKTLEEKGGYLDVSAGVNLDLGVSSTKMDEALTILEGQGYKVYSRGMEQVTNPGKQTTVMLLCPPGTEYKDVYDHTDPDKPLELVKINSVKDYISYDGGESFRRGFEYPASLDSSRLMIRYGDEGGKERDGLIEIRRGCKDLDLGGSMYAQVRIAVDDSHYIKGMAVYADDLPDGVDVRFNTNKGSDKSKLEVLKPLKKDDPSNPFGSLIKDPEHGGQYYYDDPNGKYVDPLTGHKQSLGLINKRADEGDWGEWADRLPAQFLAKQDIKLIKRQLDLSYEDMENEYNEIMSLENPVVRKSMLQSFAEDCDSKAESLHAAALPRQKYQVILPNPDVKVGEIYAPNYEDGETVALIRYPHGGTFEIPICKVNNKIESAKKMIGTTPADAVIINHETAARLSGADFDGDTVMVIPCNTPKSGIKIKSTEPFPGLVHFDPDSEYPPNPRSKPWAKGGSKEQNEMGSISNLITDMTLQNAPADEMERAVKHSMVIIDVSKHHYDYKKSFVDNGIQELKDRYQGHYTEDGRYSTGANTLISKAGAQYSVYKRTGAAKINMPDKPWFDETRPVGAKIYTNKRVNKKGEPWYDPNQPEGKEIYVRTQPDTYTTKTGKVKTRMQKSTWMAETDDAFSLSTGTVQENAYASWCNNLKKLANNARAESTRIKPSKMNSAAKKEYKTEVDHLNAQLQLAKKNAPRERTAQRMAFERTAVQFHSNPDMTSKEKKKQNQIALTEARKVVGAQRHPITISPREWEAIQAGAISSTTLESILTYADAGQVRKYAMPRSSKAVSDAKINKMKAMARMGYTNEQIARAVGGGVSASQVSYYLNDKNK